MTTPEPASWLDAIRDRLNATENVHPGWLDAGAMREDVRKLVDELNRLRVKHDRLLAVVDDWYSDTRDALATVTRVRELHVQGEATLARYNHDGTLISAVTKPDGYCRECSSARYAGCCREDADHCDGPHTGAPVSYPCPTIRALDEEQS